MSTNVFCVCPFKTLVHVGSKATLPPPPTLLSYPPTLPPPYPPTLLPSYPPTLLPSNLPTLLPSTPLPFHHPTLPLTRIYPSNPHTPLTYHHTPLPTINTLIPPSIPSYPPQYPHFPSPSYPHTPLTYHQYPYTPLTLIPSYTPQTLKTPLPTINTLIPPSPSYPHTPLKPSNPPYLPPSPSYSPLTRQDQARIKKMYGAEAAARIALSKGNLVRGTRESGYEVRGYEGIRV